MGVSLEQYRRAIGCFRRVKYGLKCCLAILSICAAVASLINLSLVIFLLIILCNDIEKNPGPDKGKLFKIGHCNIRGLRSNFSDLKVSLKTYFDIFCISETMLSNTVKTENIRIPGYQLPLRKDRNYNGGGLLIYVSNNVSKKGESTWNLLLLKPYG